MGERVVQCSEADVQRSEADLKCRVVQCSSEAHLLQEDEVRVVGGYLADELGEALGPRVDQAAVACLLDREGAALTLPEDVLGRREAGGVERLAKARFTSYLSLIISPLGPSSSNFNLDITIIPYLLAQKVDGVPSGVSALRQASLTKKLKTQLRCTT